MCTYCSNMILQDPGDGHRMFRILFGYDGQIADLEPVVGGEIFQGVLVVLGHFVGCQSRRHDGSCTDGDNREK